MTTDEFQLGAASWLQKDAAFLYRMADEKRDSTAWASDWVAMLIQNNAAHSARRARIVLGIEKEG